MVDTFQLLALIHSLLHFIPVGKTTFQSDKTLTVALSRNTDQKLGEPVIYNQTATVSFWNNSITELTFQA